MAWQKRSIKKQVEDSTEGERERDRKDVDIIPP